MSEFNFRNPRIMVDPKTGGLYFYIKNETTIGYDNDHLYISLNKHDLGYLYCATGVEFNEGLEPVKKISADGKTSVAIDYDYHMRLPLNDKVAEYKNVKCGDGTILDLSDTLYKTLFDNQFFTLCQLKIVKKIKCGGNINGDPVGNTGYLLKSNNPSDKQDYFMTSDFEYVYKCDSSDNTAKINTNLKNKCLGDKLLDKRKNVLESKIIKRLSNTGSNFFDTLEYVGPVKSIGEQFREPEGIDCVSSKFGRLFKQLQFDGKTYEYYFFNVETKKMFKCKVDDVQNPKEVEIKRSLDGQCVATSGKLKDYEQNCDILSISSCPHQLATMSNAVIESLKLCHFKIVTKPINKEGVLKGKTGTVLKSMANKKFYMLLDEPHLLVDCGDKNPIEEEIDDSCCFNSDTLMFDANIGSEEALNVSNLQVLSDFLKGQKILELDYLKLEIEGDPVEFATTPLINHKGIFAKDKDGKIYFCDFSNNEFIRFKDNDGKIVSPGKCRDYPNAFDSTNLKLEVFDHEEFEFVDYDDQKHGKNDHLAMWEQESPLRDVFVNSNKKVLKNIIDIANLEYIDYGTIKIDGKKFENSAVFKGGKDGKERYILLNDEQFLKSGNINSDDDIFADINNINGIVFDGKAFEFNKDFDKDASTSYNNDNGPVFRLLGQEKTNIELAKLNLKPVTSGKVKVGNNSGFCYIFSGGTDNKKRYILLANSGILLNAGDLDVSNPLAEVGKSLSSFWDQKTHRFSAKFRDTQAITNFKYWKRFKEREKVNMRVLDMKLKIVDFGTVNITGLGSVENCTVFASKAYFYVYEPSSRRFIKSNKIDGNHKPLDDTPNISEQDVVLQKDEEFGKDNNENNLDFSTVACFDYLMKDKDKKLALNSKIKELDLKPVYSGTEDLNAIISNISALPTKKEKIIVCVGKDLDDSNSERYYIVCDDRLIKGNKLSDNIFPYGKVENAQLFNSEELKFEVLDYNNNNVKCRWLEDFIASLEPINTIVSKLELKVVAYGNIFTNSGTDLGECLIFANSNYYYVLTQDNRFIIGNQIKNHSPFDKINLDKVFQKDGSFKKDNNESNADASKLKSIEIKKKSSKPSIVIAKLQLKPVAYGTVKFVDDNKSRVENNCTIFVGKDGTEDFYFVLTEKVKDANNKFTGNRLVKGAKVSEGKGPFADIQSGTFFSAEKCEFSAPYDRSSVLHNFVVIQTLLNTERTGIILAKLNLKPVAYGTVKIGDNKKDNCIIFVGKDENDGNKDFYFVLTEDGKLVKGEEISKNSNPFDSVNSNNCFDGQKFNGIYDEAIDVSEALKRRLDSCEKVNLTIAKLHLKPVTCGTVKIGDSKKNNCTIFVGKDENDGNDEFYFVLTEDGKLVKGIKLSDAEGVPIAKIVPSDEKFFNGATCSFDKKYSNTNDNDKINETEAFKTLTDKLEKLNLAIAKLQLKPVAYGTVKIGDSKKNNCIIFVGKDENDADRYFILDNSSVLVKGAKVSDDENCFNHIAQGDNIAFNNSNGKFDQQYTNQCSNIYNSAFTRYFMSHFGTLDLKIVKFNLQPIDFGDVEIGNVKNDSCIIFIANNFYNSYYALTKDGKLCNGEDRFKYGENCFLGSGGLFSREYNDAINVDDFFVIQLFRKKAAINEKLYKVSLKDGRVQLVKIGCNNANADIHNKYGILLTDGDSGYDCILSMKDLKIYKGDGKENNGTLKVKDPNGNEVVLNKNGEYGKESHDNLVCDKNNVKDIKSLLDIVNNEDVKKMLNFAKLSVKDGTARLAKINSSDDNINGKYGILLTDGDSGYDCILSMKDLKIYKGDGKENNGTLEVKDPNGNEVVLNKNGEYGKESHNNLVCYKNNVKDIKSLSDIVNNEDVFAMAVFAKIRINEPVKQVKIECDDENVAIHDKYGVVLQNNLVLCNGKIYKYYANRTGNTILKVKDPSSNKVVLCKDGNYEKTGTDNLVIDESIGIDPLLDVIKNTEVKKMLNFAKCGFTDGVVKSVKISCPDPSINGKCGVLLKYDSGYCILHDNKIFKGDISTDSKIITVAPLDNDVTLQKSGEFGRGDDQVVNGTVDIKSLSDIVNNEDVKKIMKLAKFSIKYDKDSKVQFTKISCDGSDINNKTAILVTDGNSGYDCVFCDGKIYKGENTEKDGILKVGTDVLQASGDFGSGSDLDLTGTADIGNLEDIVNIAVPELAIASLELEYKSNAKDKSKPAHDGFYFISKNNRHFFYDNDDKKIIECTGQPKAGIVSFASNSKYLNSKTGEFNAKADDSPTHPENSIKALKKVMVESGVLAGFEFVDPQPEGITGELFKYFSNAGESYIIRTKVNDAGVYQPCNNKGEPSDKDKFLIKGCLGDDGLLDTSKMHENKDLLGDNDIPALKYQFELSNRTSKFKLDADSKFIELKVSHDTIVKGVVVNVKNNGVFDSSEKKYCVTEDYRLYELNSEGNSVVGNQKKISQFNSLGVFKVEDCGAGNDENAKLTFDDLNRIGVIGENLFTYKFKSVSEFVKDTNSGLKVVLEKPGKDDQIENLYLKRDDWSFYKEDTCNNKAFINLNKANIDDDDSKGGKSKLKDLEVIKNKLESEGYIVYSIDGEPQKKDDLYVGGNKINGYVFKLKNPYDGENKYVYLVIKGLLDNSIKKGDLLLMTDENTFDLNGANPNFVKFDGLKVDRGGQAVKEFTRMILKGL